jgi:hypothetical protein
VTGAKGELEVLVRQKRIGDRRKAEQGTLKQDFQSGGASLKAGQMQMGHMGVD